MESWAHRDTMEPKGPHLEAHSLDVGDLKNHGLCWQCWRADERWGIRRGRRARVFHKGLYFNLGLYEVLDYNLKKLFHNS